MRTSKIDSQNNWLLYDGECPFCSHYVRLLRLRELSPGFMLRDARGEPELVKEMLRLGYDIDEGMILRWAGDYFHGADCIAQLSILADTETAGQRLNRAVFADRQRARWIYPWLVRGRNMVLKVLGRRPIGADEHADGPGS